VQAVKMIFASSAEASLQLPPWVKLTQNVISGYLQRRLRLHE